MLKMTKLQNYLLVSLSNLFKDSDKLSDVYDILSELDEYNRNNITNDMAQEFLDEYNINLWDFASGYIEYCNFEFGGYKSYQGDDETIIKYKAFCLWIDSFLAQSIDDLFQDNEITENTFCNEFSKYIESVNFSLIEDYYFD